MESDSCVYLLRSMGICYSMKYQFFNLWVFATVAYFPLCSKKTITEFVSCFIGSLVVKVIKYRFVAPREGCYQDGCVSLIKYGPTCHYGK